MSRMFTKEICFFTTDQMYTQLRKVSKEMNTSISYLIRTSIREFLQSEGGIETEPKGEIISNTGGA
jgi:hypothetical protein